MNNKERTQWINNDEGLYRWRREERGSMAQFLKAHAPEIDAYIEHQQHRYDGNGGTDCRPDCPYYRFEK